MIVKMNYLNNTVILGTNCLQTNKLMLNRITRVKLKYLKPFDCEQTNKLWLV